jgi:peptidoglycan hydrolase-like protein with peptidoglycan-binding domain
LLPGGATAPEVVLALPAPQQAKVSGAIDDIIEAEVLALGAPPPKGVPDIPPQIFTLPEKSKKLEKLFKYAAAAGLTTGLIVVLAKADPSGALATILGVSSDGKTSKTGSAGSGGNAKARRTRIAHANVKAKTPEDSVKTFQNLLIKQGYPLPRFGADGDYGDETVGAVKAFQGAKGLKVDGVVGKDTWAALSGKKAATVNKLKPKDVVTQNTAKKTEVTINQLITRMRNAQDKNGNPSPKIQQTINAYVDFRDRLVTKLKIIAGSQNLTQSSRAGLYKIVDKTFPPVPTGKAATQYTFVTGKFRELPDKILTGQAVFGDVGIRPKQVLALAIKILKEYEQQDLATNQGRAGTDVSQAQTLNQRDTDTGVRMPNDATKAANRDPNRTRTNPDGTVIPESKSYNIDFSKWKPMIKNSY